MSELNDASTALWQCFEQANEIISMIEQIYKFNHQRNNENLREILQTMEKLKNITSTYSSKQPKNAAFDYLLLGIKTTLTEINKNLQNFEIDLPNSDHFKWELNILRQDLLLSYRIDQLSSIFIIFSSSSPTQLAELSHVIYEKAAVAFWTHSFAKDVQNF